MKKSSRRFSLVLCFAFLIVFFQMGTAIVFEDPTFSSLAFAKDKDKDKDKKRKKGIKHRVNAIEESVNDLQNQIDTIELTPGPQGPAGPTGPAGPAGTDGNDGSAGPQGPIGLTGPAGPTGPAGSAGADGNDGAAGPQGPIGLTGPAGPAGPTGAAGATGATGSVGPQGIQGPMGAQGPQGIQGIPGTANSKVLFTRWGRFDCPAGANVVYNGVAMGGRHNHTGGSPEQLCLARPLASIPAHSNSDLDGALIYPSVYWGYLPQYSALRGHAVPCTVCERPGKAVQFRYPGSHQCPGGSSVEYQGWLMSSHYTHAHNTNYICVDATPSSGGQLSLDSGNQNGSLLYTTEAQCGGPGSSICPPFVEHQEVACTICTR